MLRLRLVFIALTCLPLAAMADTEGARLFQRCAACHSIVAPDGEVLVFGGLVGPNLYGIAGGRAAARPAFNYSPSLRAAGTRGLTWSEADFVAYLRNPTEFLKTYLGDPSARGRMAYRLDANADAVYRYLRSLD